MPITSINLRLEPGQKVTLQPVSWQKFEEILAQHRALGIEPDGG